MCMHVFAFPMAGGGPAVQRSREMRMHVLCARPPEPPGCSPVVQRSRELRMHVLGWRNRRGQLGRRGVGVTDVDSWATRVVACPTWTARTPPPTWTVAYQYKPLFVRFSQTLMGGRS